MTIADPVNLVAGVTAVALVLVKPQDECALGIVLSISSVVRGIARRAVRNRRT